MNELVKYVVTDPCYLLPEDIWDECCKVFDTYNNDEFMYQRFNEVVSKALTEFSGFPAYAWDTSIGDWSNEIYGSNIIKHDFFADAGMICVCRLYGKILYQLRKKYGNDNKFSGMAVFEMSEHIKVDFDISDKHWTVVNIKDKISGYEISLMNSNDFYYDCERDY